ncbi:prefoldin subunit 5-like [Halichondria panicea]|uniref:prefoldin subunit 5-like n=1 Tax=Halichondria panicea TaxID=6063 RepID=UPI00312B63E9
MAVNASQLSLPQLDNVKTQLEEEVQLIQSSMQQLKTVQRKLKDSQDSLETITPENEGKTILVPLTNSMYVPGKLKNCDKVIVDVGTGYYVEKGTKEASQFFQRKIDYVTKNLEKMQGVLIEKMKMRESIVSVMQMKIAGMEQTQTVAK